MLQVELDQEVSNLHLIKFNQRAKTAKIVRHCAHSYTFYVRRSKRVVNASKPLTMTFHVPLTADEEKPEVTFVTTKPLK